MADSTTDTEFRRLVSAAMMQPNCLVEGVIRQARMNDGVQGKELARAMGVSPARISVLERDEVQGAVTLKMMQKAALALGYEFEYAFVRKQTDVDKPRIRLDSADLTRDENEQAALLLQAFVNHDGEGRHK